MKKMLKCCVVILIENIKVLIIKDDKLMMCQ